MSQFYIKNLHRWKQEGFETAVIGTYLVKATPRPKACSELTYYSLPYFLITQTSNPPKAPVDTQISPYM